MTYEHVIEWIEENIEVLEEDDFESFYDRANDSFTSDNRNSLDDILPQSFIDDLENHFNEQKDMIAEAEEELEEEEEPEEPEKEPKPVENTIKRAISSIRSFFRI